MPEQMFDTPTSEEEEEEKASRCVSSRTHPCTTPRASSWPRLGVSWVHCTWKNLRRMHNNNDIVDSFSGKPRPGEKLLVHDPVLVFRDVCIHATIVSSIKYFVDANVAARGPQTSKKLRIHPPRATIWFEAWTIVSTQTIASTKCNQYISMFVHFTIFTFRNLLSSAITVIFNVLKGRLVDRKIMWLLVLTIILHPCIRVTFFRATFCWFHTSRI